MSHSCDVGGKRVDVLRRRAVNVAVEMEYGRAGQTDLPGTERF
jgi:hypothetical protein